MAVGLAEAADLLGVFLNMAAAELCIAFAC